MIEEKCTSNGRKEIVRVSCGRRVLAKSENNRKIILRKVEKKKYRTTQCTLKTNALVLFSVRSEFKIGGVSEPLQQRL